ncbi:hypothetical protein J4Q44_G00306390 [Coregonus suidteri]|uniref:Uncharacterized protein n=1 Tax=Coregonus suidteri TaxID=861788 RepID=A0AAN8L1B9_9TELE
MFLLGQLKELKGSFDNKGQGMSSAALHGFLRPATRHPRRVRLSVLALVYNRKGTRHRCPTKPPRHMTSMPRLKLRMATKTL